MHGSNETAAALAQPPRNRADRFAHIDALRALAVMLVVCAHAGLGWIIPGGSGVTIFFAISGFIITFLVLRERDKTGGFSTGGFYFRRAAKIFPPFAVLILVPTLIYANRHPIEPVAVAAQIGFVYNWIAMHREPDILPGSGVVWSLAIEEQFYLAFAAIWMAIVARASFHRALIALSVAAIVGSTALRVWLAASGAAANDRIYFGTDTRLDGIAWGMLSATLLHRWSSTGSRDNAAVRLLSHDGILILASLMYLTSLAVRDEWFRNTLRYTLQSTATCLVIICGLLPGGGPLRRAVYRVATSAPVSAVGLASYSIYLVHHVLMLAIAPWLAAWPAAARFALLIALSVATGYAAYRMIEVPALRWRQARESSRPVPQAGGAETGP